MGQVKGSSVQRCINGIRKQTSLQALRPMPMKPFTPPFPTFPIPRLPPLQPRNFRNLDIHGSLHFGQAAQGPKESVRKGILMDGLGG